MLVVPILMPTIFASLPKMSGRYTGSHLSLGLDGELKVYKNDTFDIEIRNDDEVVVDCSKEERGIFLRKGQSNELAVQGGCIMDALDEIWSELDEVRFDPKRRMIKLKITNFLLPDITLDLMYRGEVEVETKPTTKTPVTKPRIIRINGEEDRKPTKCKENQYVSSNTCTPCAPGSTREAGDDATSENTECTRCDAHTSNWSDKKWECTTLAGCKYVKNWIWWGGRCSLAGCDAHTSYWSDAKSQCEMAGCKYEGNSIWWGGRCSPHGISTKRRQKKSLPQIFMRITQR